jgi:pyroglutamyl-peptidase
MASRPKVALVTGFEPFGNHALNPSAEIVRRLDGARIGGVRVAGRILPVDLARIGAAITQILDEVDPVAILNLGLAAGEPVIRLERVAVNLADFEIADNAGAKARELTIVEGGEPGLWSRLPLPAIREALLGLGIPARMSNSAGTYLCNAVMYRFLAAVPARVPCGFIHLPLLRAQVAAMMESQGDGSDSTLIRLASMEFPTMRKAIETALATTISARVGTRRRKPRAKA